MACRSDQRVRGPPIGQQSLNIGDQVTALGEGGHGVAGEIAVQRLVIVGHEERLSPLSRRPMPRSMPYPQMSKPITPRASDKGALTVAPLIRSAPVRR